MFVSGFVLVGRRLKRGMENRNIVGFGRKRRLYVSMCVQVAGGIPCVYAVAMGVATVEALRGSTGCL